MIHELRWRDGRRRRLESEDTITDAEGRALLAGEGQLVAIADDGQERVILDAGVTLLVPVERVRVDAEVATPLRAIFVLRGDKVAWWHGRRFDSIEDFDAVVGLHRAARPQTLVKFRVTLLLEWADGARRILTLDPLVDTLGERLRRMLLSTLMNPAGDAGGAPPRTPR